MSKKNGLMFADEDEFVASVRSCVFDIMYGNMTCALARKKYGQLVVVAAVISIEPVDLRSMEGKRIQPPVAGEFECLK